MKKKLKKILPALLAICMLVSILPAASASGELLGFYSVRAEASKGGQVLASSGVVVGGGSVTVTIAADEGYVIEYLDVNGMKYFLGAEGVDWKSTTLAVYTFELVLRDSYLVACFKESTGEEVVPTPEWDNPYTDVAKDAWYYDGVRYVTENGAMDAAGAATFAPDRNTTRGEVVMAIWNIMGQQAAIGKTQFSDLTQGDLLYRAVAWCSDNNIVQGLPDGTFGPEKEVTREQLAAFLYRFAELLHKAAPSQKELTFVDANRVSGYAAEAVKFMSEQGVINGNELGEFMPQGNSTRGAVAAMLLRFSALY